MKDVPTLSGSLVRARQMGKSQHVWRSLKHKLVINGGVPNEAWAFYKNGYWITWLPTGEVKTMKELEYDEPTQDSVYSRSFFQ